MNPKTLQNRNFNFIFMLMTVFGMGALATGCQCDNIQCPTFPVKNATINISSPGDRDTITLKSGNQYEVNGTVFDLVFICNSDCNTSIVGEVFVAVKAGDNWYIQCNPAEFNEAINSWSHENVQFEGDPDKEYGIAAFVIAPDMKSLLLEGTECSTKGFSRAFTTLDALEEEIPGVIIKSSIKFDVNIR